MRTGLGLVVVVAIALAARAAASAEPPNPTAEQARKHFEEGTKAFNLGEFQRAVTEYKAAYNAKPDPVFLYNIAQSYRLANDLTNALFFYRSFLRNAADAPNRREVEARIRTLEQQLAQQHAVTQAPPNTPIGPGSTASTPPSRAAPEPAVAAAPPASVEKPLPSAPPPAVVEKPAPTVPQPAEAAKAAAEPPPGPAPGALATSGAASRGDRGTPVYKKWWLWTIVGVVVVGAAVGIGVGVAESGSASPPRSALGVSTVF